MRDEESASRKKQNDLDKVTVWYRYKSEVEGDHFDLDKASAKICTKARRTDERRSGDFSKFNLRHIASKSVKSLIFDTCLLEETIIL
jgi:hypothetical protein